MSEPYFSRVHTENVVLDIGGDVGAAIFFTPGVLQGEEIEVAPLPDAAPKTHTEVVQRQVHGQTVFTGVFPALPIGDYEVCRPRERAGERFSIRSGQVTDVSWS